jgi:hypothetical protein
VLLCATSSLKPRHFAVGATEKLLRSPFRVSPPGAMVKYSGEADAQKSCKARGSDLRVHFKVRGAGVAAALQP